jgi:hypothetical protein
VTESSTLDGTAVAADASVVVSGNTSQHDGTNTAVEDVGTDEDGDTTNGETKDEDEASDTEDQSSNTMLIAGSAIGVLGIVIGIAVVVLRGRNGDAGKDFSSQLWTDGAAQPVTQQPVMQQPAMMAQPNVPMQPAQPVVQQPVMQQPVAPQPVMTAPAPPAVATAPAPPAQPTTVADYTGLPPGGTYDQSTGQTIYIQTDGVRWQMMTDGSFNRIN